MRAKNIHKELRSVFSILRSVFPVESIGTICMRCGSNDIQFVHRLREYDYREHGEEEVGADCYAALRCRQCGLEYMSDIKHHSCLKKTAKVATN